MRKLIVICGRCGLEFALRDNGFTDPALSTCCPRCGSTHVHPRRIVDRVA